MNQSATASLMRKLNSSAVLTYIREHSPASRSQIARHLNMSLPTVMRVMEDLMAEDLVRPSGTSEVTKGRPGPLLEFNGAAYTAIGVDMGGTKMFGTVANLSGTVLCELYEPLNGAVGDEALERLCALLQRLLDTAHPSGQRVRGIGVGAPGPTLNPEGIVAWAPSLGWRDVPLREILAQRFDVPVFVENDVNLAALGEYGFGIKKNVRSLVCIAVGTGIGAGIIIDGMLYRGHRYLAGEVGYLIPGTPYLGRSYDEFGALETLASGSGIARRAQQLLEQKGIPMPPAGLTAEDVFAAARHGETWAIQIVDETVDYLSLAIASVACVLDPELIVIGGGVSRSSDLLIEPITRRLRGALLNVPPIVASSLGYRAAVMGAIMLVFDAMTGRQVVRHVS